ncbi:MAG: MBL fold metallo-hydrolase, partial [Chloroflexi bacterium]|nr:MBL fold metallo-hydrolase [Chloroflexota bacterium]
PSRRPMRHDALYTQPLRETGAGSGLCELIDAPYAITESVHLKPSPGHTPGHVYVTISSGGEEALITGDALHHKLQLAAPDLPDSTDRGGDPGQALRTRMALFERLVDTNTLMLGGHFEPPAAGYLRRHRDGYALLPNSVTSIS